MRGKERIDLEALRMIFLYLSNKHNHNNKKRKVKKRKKQMNTEPTKFEKNPDVTCHIETAYMQYEHTHQEGEPKRITEKVQEQKLLVTLIQEVY